MADFTFLFNRKGALYPLDFKLHSNVNTNNINNNQKTNNHINNEWPFNNLLDSTLVHLCSKVIVNLPSKQLDRMIDLIPAELFIPLFKASLYPVRDNAIDVSLLIYLFIYLF